MLALGVLLGVVMYQWVAPIRFYIDYWTALALR
jgi:hypothetical protein